MLNQLHHHQGLLGYLNSQPEILSHVQLPSLQIDQIEPIYHTQQCLTVKMSFMNSTQNVQMKIVLTENANDTLTQEEYILRNLHNLNYPVLKPLALCLDHQILNYPFMISKHIDGRTFHDLKLNDLSPVDKIQILVECVKTISQLHSLQLLNFNSLQRIENPYFVEIEKHKRNYKQNETKLDHQIEDLLYWLPFNVPTMNENDHQCLIHGNMKLDNFVFHPKELKILAIVNWQESYIGNSYIDLGSFFQDYYIEQTSRTQLLNGVRNIVQYINIPDHQFLLQKYFENRLNISDHIDLRYQVVLSLCKLAVQAQCEYKDSLGGDTLKQNKGLHILQVGQQAAQVGWEIINEMTYGDPFNIKEKVMNDSHKWGQWQISERCKSYYYRIKDFMKKEVYPNEREIYLTVLNRTGEDKWKGIQLLESIQQKAKQLGLWNLFLSDPMYGVGLTNLEYTFLSELMGTSYFGHETFNCFAPETGNIKLLIGYGTPEQKQKYLVPLIEGTCKTFFAMSEKEVSSSDPNNFQTTITPVQGGYILKGSKWFVSGIGDARCKFGIVMGKSDLTAKPLSQQSMIIVDMPNANVKVLRTTHVLGFDDAPHGYFEVLFDNVFIPQENLLGKAGGAFAMAQRRLVGSRLAHSVRQVGQTQKCLDLMMERSDQRVLFGRKLKDMQSFQQVLGDLEIKLQSCRQLLLNAAMLLDKLGGRNYQTLKAISECKGYVPKTTQKILDQIIQAFGAEGVSYDQMIAMAFQLSRAIRFMDGPCELHTQQVARFAYGNHMFNDLRESEGYGMPKL